MDRVTSLSPPPLRPPPLRPPPLRVVAAPHPFRADVIDHTVPAGGTIADILAAVQPDPILRRHAHVYVGDLPVPPSMWARVRPRAGQTVTLRVVPGKGGGGGGGGKSPLRVVLSIAVMAASLALGGVLGEAMGLSTNVLFSLGPLEFSQASLVGGAIISFVGNAIVNSVVPPPVPRMTPMAGLGAGGGFDRASPALAITGVANRMNPWGVVPRIYGRVRVYPTVAARQYTEVVGNDQYLRCLFDFGYGPLELTDLRIGAVPIGQYEGIETEIRPGWPDDPPLALYSDTIREDPYSLKVTAAGGPQVIESRDNADEVVIDIGFNGLVYWTDGGGRSDQSVALRIEWRKVGAEEWQLLADETITAATETAVRRSWRVVTGEAARHQMRVTRVTADNTSTRIRDEMFVSALRTVQYTHPVRPTGRCLLAVRIKATHQLSGAIDQLSAVATSVLRVRDGEAWVWQATRNPAWVLVDILTGSARKTPSPDQRLDLPALQAWADACDAPSPQDDGPMWTFDHVIDYPTTLFEAARMVCAIGRAAFSLRDGKFSVVRDLPQDPDQARQMFTPRTSWGFQATRTFREATHALRVRYLEPAREWTQQEVIVFADGHSEETATRYETLELLGCARRSQAWREGRYHLAAGTLRPETYELNASAERLVCARGDLVRVGHDVPLWGVASGRVQSLVTAEVDGQPRVVGVTLDERVVMEAGKNYVLRVRRETAASVAFSLVTVPGESATLAFVSPAPPGQEPGVGDLAAFGEAGHETALLLVKAIHPGPDLSARMVLVDAGPDVHQADTGPIPEWDPLITRPPAWMPGVPAAPALAEVVSDESVLIALPGGLFQPRLVIRLAPRAGGEIPERIEILSRAADSGTDWTVHPSLPGGGSEIIIAPVEEGQRYDVRIRAVSRLGVASDWTAVNGHQIVGKTSPPPDVPTLMRDPERIRWSYPAPPVDLAGFLIRTHAGDNRHWESAAPAHDPAMPVAATSFPLADLPAGARTIMLKAVDTGGRESVTAAVLVTDLGEAVVGNVIESVDFAALGWPGIISGGAVVEGQIAADDIGAFWTADEDPMWAADGDPMWTSIYGGLAYAFTVLPDADVLDATLMLAAEIEGAASQIEFRPDSQAPFWTADEDPMWTADEDAVWGALSAWAVWPGVLAGLWHQRIFFRADVNGGAIRGRIQSLVATFDVPDRAEFFEDVAIAAGGSRLPVTHGYRRIKVVGGLVLQADGGGAVSVRVDDKDPVLGPLIKCFDGAGAACSGTVDATIQGY